MQAATSLQTFPNGGYILFEVTADAPGLLSGRFAESTDLERPGYGIDVHRRRAHPREQAARRRERR
jgi:hypothetical protein